MTPRRPFGLGRPQPTRFPYPDRPQPSPGIAPSPGIVVRANRVIVFGPAGTPVGVFVYQPGTIPALGNPPIASMTASTVDPFGNVVKPDISVYGTGGSPSFISLLPGNPAIVNIGTGDAVESTPGRVTTSVTGSGGAKLLASIFRAPAVTGQPGTTAAFLQLTSPSADLTTTPPALNLVAQTAAVNSLSALQMNPGYTALLCSELRIVSNGPGGTGTMVIIPPSGDTSGATDPPLINFALSNGFGVQLLPGIYYTNVPINIPPKGILKGMGRGMVNGDVMTEIRAVAVMDAVVCSQGWDTPGGNTGTQAAVHIAELQLNGNTNKATHGLVLQNFSSLIRDVYVRFVVQDGFRLDGFNQAGTVSLGTTSTASGVNNQFVRCVAENCTRGFVSNDPNGLFTDSLLSDGYVVNPSSFAVDIQNLGGWKVSGNHFYGLNQNGLRASIQSANTRIIGNYFEPWGATATPGQYLAINLTANDNGAATIIAGNNFWFNTAPGNATSTIIAIGFVSAIAGAVADVVIVGNGFQCAAPAASFNVAYPQQMFCTGVSTINVVSDGNLANGHWTANTHDVPGTGTINRSVGF